MEGSVDKCDEFPGCQGAETLDDQLAYLDPVGIAIEHHSQGVAAPPENEDRMAGVAKDFQLFARRAERHGDERPRIGDRDAENMSEGSLADQPPSPHPCRFLVGIWQTEAYRSKALGGVVRHVVVVATPWVGRQQPSRVVSSERVVR